RLVTPSPAPTGPTALFHVYGKPGGQKLVAMGGLREEVVGSRLRKGDGRLDFGAEGVRAGMSIRMHRTGRPVAAVIHAPVSRQRPMRVQECGQVVFHYGQVQGSLEIVPEIRQGLPILGEAIGEGCLLTCAD